jgi:hypothetical protein
MQTVRLLESVSSLRRRQCCSIQKVKLSSFVKLPIPRAIRISSDDNHHLRRSSTRFRVRSWMWWARMPGDGPRVSYRVVASGTRGTVLLMHWNGQKGVSTGVDGSRTHQGRLCSTPQTVLKTAEPTGTQPPPRTAIGYSLLPDWSRRSSTTKTQGHEAHTMNRCMLPSCLPWYLYGLVVHLRWLTITNPHASPGAHASTRSWAPGCSPGWCRRRPGSLGGPNTKHSKRCKHRWPRPADPRSA